MFSGANLYNLYLLENFLDALDREISERYNGEEVISIFIGGGTPTCLDLDELRRLFAITNKFNKNNLKEFSIESNIESLELDKILLMKDYGVNRISLGVQSFNDDILRELNRKHDKSQVFDIIRDIKSVGIVYLCSEKNLTLNIEKMTP